METNSIIDIITNTASDVPTKVQMPKLGIVNRSTRVQTIVGGEAYTNNKDEIIRYWNPDTGKYTVFGRTHFAKVLLPTGRKTIPELFRDDKGKIDYAAVGRVYSILDYVGQQSNKNPLPDNLIVKATSQGQMPATAPDIALIIGLSIDRSKRFLSSLGKLGILRKDEEKRYYISPLYVMRAAGITPDLYMLFKKELDEFLPEQAKKDLIELYRQQHNQINDTDPIVVNVPLPKQKACRQEILDIYTSHKDDEGYTYAIAYADYDITGLDGFIDQETISQRQKDKRCCIGYDYIINILTRTYVSNPKPCYENYDKLDLAFDPAQLTPELFIYLHYTVQQAVANHLTADDIVKKTYGLITHKH